MNGDLIMTKMDMLHFPVIVSSNDYARKSQEKEQ